MGGKAKAKPREKKKQKRLGEKNTEKNRDHRPKPPEKKEEENTTCRRPSPNLQSPYVSGALPGARREVASALGPVPVVVVRAETKSLLGEARTSSRLPEIHVGIPHPTYISKRHVVLTSFLTKRFANDDDDDE